MRSDGSSRGATVSIGCVPGMGRVADNLVKMSHPKKEQDRWGWLSVGEGVDPHDTGMKGFESSENFAADAHSSSQGQKDQSLERRTSGMSVLCRSGKEWTYPPMQVT